MQETARQTSIISYAGLNRDELLGQAKQYFSLRTDKAPDRFETFLPLFPFELIQNMNYLGTGAPHASALGFSLDPSEYHRKLYEQMPSLYQEDNYSRNFDYEGRFRGRSPFTVDRAWTAHFPQYQPFMGEKLMVYPIGGGAQAVAVPESLFPRGGGVLSSAERSLGITERVEQFAAYVRLRVSEGESYHPERFGADFLEESELAPVMLRQSELGRILQNASVARTATGDEDAVADLFTESAKLVEDVWQYIPSFYACDSFEAAAVARHTARLLQPCFSGMDFVSDFWIPYQDANAYINRQTMTLSMAALCKGYQIAPLYDPATGGGRYPDAVRVVIVRDRELKMLACDVLNNPAYGSGMNPQGMIGRQVFLPDSRELLRLHKLAPEDMQLGVADAALSPKEYRHCLQMAASQEAKGRLVDIMYRREAVLSQWPRGSQAYEQAFRALNEKVEQAQKEADRLSPPGHGQMSGYDADADYLRRKQQTRETIAEEDGSNGPQHESIPFAPDPLRDQSIESGYAMRHSVRRMAYERIRIEPPAPPAVAAVAAEPPPKEEPLPTPPSASECAKETVISPDIINDAEVCPSGTQASVAPPENTAAATDTEAQEEAVCEREVMEERESEPEMEPPLREPHRPVTFEALTQKAQPAQNRTRHTLDEAASVDSAPVTGTNKTGKMAALLATKSKKKK